MKFQSATSGLKRRYHRDDDIDRQLRSRMLPQDEHIEDCLPPRIHHSGPQRNQIPRQVTQTEQCSVQADHHTNGTETRTGRQLQKRGTNCPPPQQENSSQASLLEARRRDLAFVPPEWAQETPTLSGKAIREIRARFNKEIGVFNSNEYIQVAEDALELQANLEILICCLSLMSAVLILLKFSQISCDTFWCRLLSLLRSLFVGLLLVLIVFYLFFRRARQNHALTSNMHRFAFNFLSSIKQTVLEEDIVQELKLHFPNRNVDGLLSQLRRFALIRKQIKVRKIKTEEGEKHVWSLILD